MEVEGAAADLIFRQAAPRSPARDSIRTVARFVSAKAIRMMQPAKKATRFWRVRRAGTVPRGSKKRDESRGSSASASSSLPGSARSRPAPPHEPLHPEALIGAQQAAQNRQPPRVRKQLLENDLGQQPANALGTARGRGSRRGGLHQVTELHARRAGRLAGPTVQAERDVLLERIGGIDAALAERTHQVEPTARRLRLDVQFAEGRAVGQAEPTMDTLAEIGLRRRIWNREAGRHALLLLLFLIAISVFGRDEVDGSLGACSSSCHS